MSRGGKHWKVVNAAAPGTAESYRVIGGDIQQARAMLRPDSATKAAQALAGTERAAEARGIRVCVRKAGRRNGRPTIAVSIRSAGE